MEKEEADNNKKSIRIIKILAVLEIIFSSYGLLSALLAGGIFIFFSGSISTPIALTGNSQVYTIALFSARAIINILVFASAIGVLYLKDWARQLMTWAVAGAIAVSITSPFLSYIAGDKISSLSFSPMSSFFLAYSIISIALPVAYNFFVIWYFNKEGTKLIFAQQKV